MTIDPVSLQLFVHVLEEGTIAGGAKRLHIVTSAASKRLVELEAALGAQLLRRTNRGVEATAAGAELDALARRVVGELDDIPRLIRGFSTGMRGHVRVFVNASAICQSLPGELAGFMQTHPHVHVHFEERAADVILKSVSENLADIGISFVAQHFFTLEELPYRSYKLAVLVPKGHPLARRRSVSFSETLDHPHIGLQMSSAANLYFNRRADDIGMRVNYRMYAESYHAVAMLVEAGLGIGIVPEGLLRPFSPHFGVKAVPLNEAWASRELRIYFPAYARLQAASRLLVDHLKRK
jgi:DNA-binding transcriptional LysR family regulator